MKHFTRSTLNWQKMLNISIYKPLIYLIMKIKAFILSALCLGAVSVYAQNFNGLDMNMGNLSRLSNAKTRSISPENFTGEKGKGGMG